MVHRWHEPYPYINVAHCFVATKLLQKTISLLWESHDVIATGILCASAFFVLVTQSSTLGDGTLYHQIFCVQLKQICPSWSMLYKFCKLLLLYLGLKHLVPSLHGKQMGRQWKQCQTLFLGDPKSLQMVTAAMKLKDAYSLEGKL